MWCVLRVCVLCVYVRVVCECECACVAEDLPDLSVLYRGGDCEHCAFLSGFHSQIQAVAIVYKRADLRDIQYTCDRTHTHTHKHISTYTNTHKTHKQGGNCERTAFGQIADGAEFAEIHLREVLLALLLRFLPECNFLT